MEALAAVAIAAVSMFVAFRAGTAVQSLRHATQNLRKTEESIPGLKETVASSRWRSAGRVTVLLALAMIVLVLASYAR